MRERSGYHPVDVYVGERIKERRLILGISQERLAEALGVTFQQVQKYEKARNRVSASRLFEIANVLDVPVSYFFSEAGRATATVLSPAEDNPMKEPRNVRLVGMFSSLSESKRDRVFALIKDIAGASADSAIAG